MAKTSIVERQHRRERIVKRYAAKRAELKQKLRDPKTSQEDRAELRAKFQALPRDASPTRLHRRCKMSGRSHGVYRKFGLARTQLREAAMRGDVPGLVKASW